MVALSEVALGSGGRGVKEKLRFSLILILAISLITFFTVINSISPIIDRVCKDAAKAKATIVSNNMATEVMKKYTYSDMVNIYKDERGNVTMLQSNIITINEITSDVAVKIQEELVRDDENSATIKFRKFYRC